MRRARLAEIFATLPVEDVVALCAEIVERARFGAPYDVALASLTALFESELLGYEFAARLYEAARAADNSVVMRLLLSPGAGPDGRPLLPPALRDRPLGVRKSMARGHRRDQLQLLLFDPDPSVLVILLGNPRIVERDVVELAARRPTTPEAQRLIFQSPRFGPRREVRRALVLNPYTPSDLACRLVGLLPAHDLADVRRDLRLDRRVREAAAHLLDGPRTLEGRVAPEDHATSRDD